MMITQLLKQAAQRFPKHTALVYDDFRINYHQLESKVQGLSEGLSSLNIGQGDCVAFVLPNCPEFVYSFYAVAQLQGIVLPLNHLFKAEELNYCIQDSNVKAIITDLKRAKICQNIIATLDRDIELIVVDGIYPGAHYLYHLILLKEYQVKVDSENAISAEVLYQYSSGSTGKPKRIARTQANLYHEVKNFAETTNIQPSDKILCAVPMYHAHGLGNCLLAAISNGATLVILEQVLQKDGTPVEVPFVFRCPRIFELLETEKITIFPAVPYIFNALVESRTKTSVNLSSVRLCFSAGNFLSRELFEKFLERFSIPVRQLYGCTEAGSVAINLESDIDNLSSSVGFPLDNIDIKIIDEKGKEQPIGMTGEVVIKSRSLTTGYINQPELNQQAFKDGCFYTGDLGKKDEWGRVYITGRKKLLIDTGGRKVDPIEIEEILTTHPHVREAVVVGVKGSYAGELVKAVIVKKGGKNFDDQEILSFCKQRLAEFKIPKIIEFRPEIPKSPLGKILRKELV
ncbi:MAG: AMP-binding protein [Cyanobacteria bacterium J06592_8]